MQRLSSTTLPPPCLPPSPSVLQLLCWWVHPSTDHLYRPFILTVPFLQNLSFRSSPHKHLHIFSLYFCFSSLILNKNVDFPSQCVGVGGKENSVDWVTNTHTHTRRFKQKWFSQRTVKLWMKTENDEKRGGGRVRGEDGWGGTQLKSSVSCVSAVFTAGFQLRMSLNHNNSRKKWRQRTFRHCLSRTVSQGRLVKEDVSETEPLK